MVARHMRKVPVRFTPMIRFQRSRDISWVQAKVPIPAMLQTTSGRPWASTAAATPSATEASSLTSTAWAVAVPPAAVMPATVASVASRFRSKAATVAPFGGEALGHGLADARARPGDDGDLVGEALVGGGHQNVSTPRASLPSCMSWTTVSNSSRG